MENGWLVDERLVSLDIKATGRASAIKELARLLESAGRLHSLRTFIENVEEREKASSTAVGWGIAIPHARSAGVKNTSICFGRSKGFYWEPDSTELTQLVFLLAAPETIPSATYMEMLASLARSLLDPEFRASCLGATNNQEIVNAIQGTISLEEI